MILNIGPFSFMFGKDKKNKVQSNQQSNTVSTKKIETHEDWSERVVNRDIIKYVKETYEITEISKKFHPTSLYAICKFTALSLDYNERLLVEEVKSAFITAAGESVGYRLSDYDAEKLAEYYYNNFYSNEKQKELYNRRMSVDVRE